MAVAAALTGASGAALAQSSVTYGRITAVQMVTESDARARTGGAIIGGTLGAAVGSGRSGSNRALGGVGGAFAGSQIGRLASQRQAFEYTGPRRRDVDDHDDHRPGGQARRRPRRVERGAFNNLRLVPTPRARCRRAGVRPAAPPPPARPTPAEQRQSDACVQAKEQLLAAETDDAFDRAERRVRLLCGE
ncbi:MAG: hypothetical protein IPM22_10605 [Betaproteobacteria bacterium]|nr:hypothetical protein [Betaproteobacteria bacterium]